SLVAGRLLGRVGPGEGEMRRLVADDRPELVQGGPARGDPDDLGPVRGVRALEAVAHPVPRWLHRPSVCRAGRGMARTRGRSYRGDMATEDTHGLGYHRVDDDPNIDVLIAAMEATAGWDATRRLRSWERAHLGLGQGD